VEALDLSTELGPCPWPATSPNLLASFVRVLAGESLEMRARATSSAYFVIRGAGSSATEHGLFPWSRGDLLVLPACAEAVRHSATEDATLYNVTDEPLLRYLGVTPSEPRCAPALFTRAALLAAVEEVRHEQGAEHRNRLGVLLSNAATDSETRTLTPTLWALLNVLPPRTAQPPHRHNSVALDLCIDAAGGGKVYTAMGPELGEDGWVKDPVKMWWAPGACFTTPPGWWHSHHNESGEEAWVLPMQDAGLFTRQRTLDIRFSTAEPMRYPEA
jgi:gentisate 1,2-dioxygenase